MHNHAVYIKKYNIYNIYIYIYNIIYLPLSSGGAFFQPLMLEAKIPTSNLKNSRWFTQLPLFTLWYVIKLYVINYRMSTVYIYILYMHVSMKGSKAIQTILADLPAGPSMLINTSWWSVMINCFIRWMNGLVQSFLRLKRACQVQNWRSWGETTSVTSMSVWMIVQHILEHQLHPSFSSPWYFAWFWWEPGPQRRKPFFLDSCVRAEITPF